MCKPINIKKSSSKVTQQDLFCQQLCVLKPQEGNLLLEREKLNLEIQLSQLQLSQARSNVSTINLSPIYQQPEF